MGTLNPRKLIPYFKAREIKLNEERELMNLQAYINGLYEREALASTVGNMFSSGKGKPHNYPDKPFDLWKEQEEERELTEEEKLRQTEALFAMLSFRKYEFERNKQGD